MATSATHHVDLTIIGAGPVGSSLALAAAIAGFDVALVDSRPSGPPPRADNRNFAIVRGSWRLLQTIGVGDKLVSHAQPLHGLEAQDGSPHIFGAPSVLFSDDDLLNAGEETDLPLGYMVEAHRLQATLDKAVASHDRIKLLRPALFRSHAASEGHIIVDLDKGAELRASVLAGCDGVNSPVRKDAGITVETREYGRSVFAANVSLSQPHNGIARQLFTPEGPFATLPLTGNRANLAWYLPTPAAEAIAKLDATDITAELNHRFADFAGQMTLDSEPITYPLVLQLATDMTASRVALVGDAARRINPLAGQGLNLGFKDVAALVEVMHDARRVGLDPGSIQTLDRYQTWRRFDAGATALAMDGIDRLFSNNNALLKPLRGMALTVAQNIAPLRRRLAQQASADQPHLPRLLQGVALTG